MRKRCGRSGVGGRDAVELWGCSTVRQEGIKNAAGVWQGYDSSRRGSIGVAGVL